MRSPAFSLKSCGNIFHFCTICALLVVFLLAAFIPSSICLVHNGSLSNHNNVRRDLIKKGQNFKSENDTEVAAGYISNKISEGNNLKNTLSSSLKNLDGFYTFIAGTKDGFALLRDEIACKPAVVAETKDYVAVASEFQAMAHLPNVNSAKIFEPKPGVVYNW